MKGGRWKDSGKEVVWKSPNRLAPGQLLAIFHRSDVDWGMGEDFCMGSAPTKQSAPSRSPRTHRPSREVGGVWYKTFTHW